MSNSAYWDKLARKRQELKSRGSPHLHVEWEGDDPAQLFAELLAEHAKGADSALDAGCSEGEAARRIAEAAGFVTACDISRAALHTAAALTHRRNICFVQADAETMPFVDNGFDLVCSHSGPVVANPRALAEAARVMKPGAIMVALATGESHQIETQEIFGRGLNWPPVTPVRFAVPRNCAAVGLDIIFFAEYYANAYCPDIETYAQQLSAAPTIPNFDPTGDAIFLREIQRKLSTCRGIRDTRHLAVFLARKPD